MQFKVDTLSLALAGALFFASSAGAQDYQGTAEQRAACTPDAFRLCGNAIPDPGRVEACLRQQHAQLSSGCRSVFEGGGSYTFKAR